MPVTPLSREEMDARIDAAVARALSEQAAREVLAPDNLFALSTRDVPPSVPPPPSMAIEPDIIAPNNNDEGIVAASALGQTTPAAAAFTPAEKPAKPDLALITNPEPVSRTAPSGDLKVVYDADAGNTEVLRLAQDCGKLELERIKRRIERDPDGRSDAGDQRFIASALNTATTASLRANEQRWRQHIVDKLPEWLERVAEEERKLEERTIDGTLVDNGGDAA